MKRKQTKATEMLPLNVATLKASTAANSNHLFIDQWHGLVLTLYGAAESGLSEVLFPVIDTKIGDRIVAELKKIPDISVSRENQNKHIMVKW